MRLSRAAVVGVAAVVVCGGGYAAYAENTGPAASYRTATVTRANVEQTVALSGTISPAGRSDLSFTTAGTVTKVGVKVGDTVRAGQVLARLDRVALAAAVTRAQAQLDAARARLASDEDAQAASASASASASAAASAATAAPKKPSPKPSSSAPAAPSSGGSAALAQLKQQQGAVTSAQSATTAALATAKAALADEQQVCTAQASATASPTATSSATADPSVPVGQVSQSAGSSSTDRSACDDAIAAVQDAQAKVDDAQGDLQKALDALAATLADAANQGSSPSPSNSPSGATAPSAKPSANASGSGSDLSGAGGTGGKTVTAATLASDQAQIDSARSSLVTAQQSLSGSTLRAPHAGTVGEIDVATGDSATAGSTAVVVLSPGATEIDLTVTATQVAKLKVGQVAEVTPAGASKPLTGTITRITPVPDSNSDYPVTVTLDDDGLELPAGGTAAVDIVVGHADGVLTVPTSAVSNGAVEVLDGSTVTRTRVTTGVVGATRTEISAGLKAGQRVVLADLSAAVPTSQQQNGFGGRGPAGGLGGLSGGTFQAPAGGFVVPKG